MPRETRDPLVSTLGAWHEVGPARVAVLDVAGLPESTFHPFLTDADLEAAGRVRVPLGRATALASRALARSVWADLLDLAPRDVPVRRWCPQCRRTGHGRPWVDHSLASDFSISHAAGLVVLAVVAAGAVGVDVEELRELDRLERLASSTLTPAEAADLHSGDGPASYRYLATWTRKEAAVKLTGIGLALPFTSVDTTRDPLVLPGHPAPVSVLPLPLPAGYTGHLAHSPARSVPEPVGPYS